MRNLEYDDRVAQVQVLPFRQNAATNEWELLILKRNAARGGFWQPVTGGMHPEEPVIEAAYRELGEETGATKADCNRLVYDGYTFEFTGRHHGVERTFTEYVTAAVLRPDIQVTISDEHVDFKWMPPLGAMAMLGYDSGRDALAHYLPIITDTN